MALTVVKDEMTVILDLHHRRLKLTVFVTILEIAVTTKEIRSVKRHNLLVVAIAKVEQIALKDLHNLLQQGLAVSLLAKDLIQRHRIGRVAVELLLIDINAGADDTVADMSLRQAVLNDGSTDLLVVPIDIVRPLDGDAFGVLRQHVVKGQRQSL